ncbi:hypothetical protein LINPERHAP1_LOCUS15094 [Linum perenne]
MPDLNEYLFHCVEDDEEANLRISRYYKKWIKSGGFEIDCPPFVDGGYAGFIFNKEHFVNYPNFDTMLEASVRFGIDKYNQETGNQMKLLQIMNVTVGKVGCQMVFFQTLKCSVVDHGTICNVGIYQSVVSYDVLIETCEVLVFRRESDGQGLMDLILKIQ